MQGRGSQPIAKDLVLAGGGHAHALVLRMLAMRVLPGVRVTLVSDAVHAPYSGMLPGYVAGFYSYDEAHIDLPRLCQAVGARFVHASVSGLDLEAKELLCDGRPPLPYDVLSLNVGAVAAPDGVPGAAEHTVAVKPVGGFVEAWDDLVMARSQSADAAEPALVIVGGGAGGVELALAMHARLRGRVRIQVIHSDAEIGTGLAPGARRRLARLLGERGISVATGERVVAVERGSLRTDSGRDVAFDRCFWATGPSPAPWLAATGLAVDEQGFVRVRPTLQTLTRDDVLAAGDMAAVEGMPRPRSGVFAVRQARPLLASLLSVLRGEAPRPCRLQRRFLSLVGTGEGTAVASRGSWSAEGAWLWWLKNRIDRAFMRRFEAAAIAAAKAEGMEEAEEPQAPDAADASAPARVRCQGCGAKVGGDVLRGALARIAGDAAASSRAVVDLAARDDAAVIEVPPGLRLVQSVDFMPALMSDPYVFGRIAANHAFSDVYAMGGEALGVLAAVNVPEAAPAKMEAEIAQLLAGVVAACREMGAVLLGGHTSEADGGETGLGLTANGLVAPDRIWRKGGLKPGDALVLTKALGVGTLFAAAMRGQAKGRWLERATASMLASNRAAAQVFAEVGVSACTDVTGFGLAGHLLEMADASRRAVRVELRRVPVLLGARETLAHGIVSSIDPANRRVEARLRGAARAHPAYGILFDPQTSGGLLAGVPAAEAARCVAMLRARGCADAAVIGEVLDTGVGSGALVEGEEPWIDVF